MTNISALDNVAHADLTVDRHRGGHPSENVNQVIVFPTEFRDVQREYPIFFRRDAAGRYFAVALLGLDRDENLFIKDGRWDARYIPAAIDRGPFSIGSDQSSPNADLAIHIDLDDARVGVGKGEALFLPQGGYAPYLRHVTTVLKKIHVGLGAAGPMFDELSKAELIEPVTLQLNLSETEGYSVPEVYSINEARLRDLDGATVAAMNASGLLALCHLVAASRDNVQTLLGMKLLANASK